MSHKDKAKHASARSWAPGAQNALKLKITLRSPSAPASAELLEWCGDWNPEAFDLEALNRLLRQ